MARAPTNDDDQYYEKEATARRDDQAYNCDAAQTSCRNGGWETETIQNEATEEGRTLSVDLCVNGSSQVRATVVSYWFAVSIALDHHWAETRK
jgi:hypothetical protein